tara:strand:- start:2575 stop:2703 length:129 start_codon:yes stop_codon:yes gene_type:complete
MVAPPTGSGMTVASIMRMFSTPRTRRLASTTAAGPRPDLAAL